MIKSTYWIVSKSIDEDCEEVIDTFGSRDDAEAYASWLSDEYEGDHFLVRGNNASSPCWMSW